MSARRHTLRAAAAVTAVVALAAGCSSANSNHNKNSGGAATGVLNIGKPDGPQTNNSNPFLNTSAGATLGYRWMIYEPLTMVSQIRPADKPDPWLATDWKWDLNFTKVTLTID
ncbi:ABC transporter substrate-binding protein, partial [Streptomyces sp. DT225]